MTNAGLLAGIDLKHTEEILVGLGYTPHEIAALLDDSVVYGRKPSHQSTKELPTRDPSL